MSRRKLYKKPELARKLAINHFDCVPDEILYKIVSIFPLFDLCTLAMVSQRFQRVCGDKRLWESLSLTNITYSQIEMLIASSFPIKELHVSWSWIFDSKHRRRYHRGAISSNFHMTLEKLTLMPAQHKNDFILYVLERFKTKKLILDRLPYVCNLNSELIKAISKHENLEVLSMEWRSFDQVSVNDIQVLFNGSNRLKELNLSGCDLSTIKLRAICDHIPETVEKLVLLDATFYKPGAQVRIRRIDREDYDADFEMECNAVAESFEVLFHRNKNLKYFGTPLQYLKISIARTSQYQSLETLGLCGDEATLRSCEDHFRNPNFASVLEKMAPKLKRIDIVLKVGWWLDEEERALLQGSARAALEELRKAIFCIDVEVYVEELGIFNTD